MKHLTLIIIFILILSFFTSCQTTPINSPTIIQPSATLTPSNTSVITPINTPLSTPSCDKELNCCTQNDDCKYIWFTGGCNTPEYVAKRQKEAQEKGMQIGEAPPRDNVSCTCENNMCITHN